MLQMNMCSTCQQRLSFFAQVIYFRSPRHPLVRELACKGSMLCLIGNLDASQQSREEVARDDTVSLTLVSAVMNRNGEEEMSDDESKVKTLEEEMSSGDESKEMACEFVQVA